VITIIDYGMGNAGSIANMLRRIGAPSLITSRREDVEKASKLILPGVGAFDTGMAHLDETGLRGPLDDKVLRGGTPVIGLCLGMQLLGRRSEEGQRAGLGWLDAETVRFRFDPKESKLKIPHMGWNTVTRVNDSPMFAGFTEPPRFYFVHSYHVECRDPRDVAATVRHGYEVTAAVQRGSIYGVQFHPEKSHKFGMAVLRFFASLPC
jgi:glutamine amidotransferase